MRTQDKKMVREVLYYMGFVFLLFTMLASGVEGKWEEAAPVLPYLIESGVMNPDMADLLLTDCMIELLKSKKPVQDHALHFLVKTSDSNELLNDRPSRIKLHDIINVLTPQVNQILVDCVRGKNIMIPVMGEEKGSDTWYTRYLSFLFTLHWTSQRRELAQISGEAPGPAPTVSPGPATSVPLAPPANRPASPPLIPFFPPGLDNPSLRPTAGEPSSANTLDVKPNNQKTNNRTVIIAVVVTASVTFAVATLVFFFWHRCCGTGWRRRRNDNRPLLSLSLSDYSIASPQKSFGLGIDEKLGSQSFSNKANHISGNFYMDSHSLSNPKIEIPVGTTAGHVPYSLQNPIPLPPRMSVVPGLPPLKPPPGRTDLLKPPLVNIGTPRPAAPTLPQTPYIKPSSASPRPQSPDPPGPPPVNSGVKAGPLPPPPPIPSGSKAGPHPPPLPTPFGVKAGPHPPPPPIPSSVKAGPRPPPPPGASMPPPRPPPSSLKPPRSVPSGPRHSSASTSIEEGEAGVSKAKLKPFFWDKVLADPDHSMVWHQIKSGSFQFNEEMIESLFGYASTEKNKNDAKKESSPQDLSTKYIQIIDPKKSQNLSIMLKALNVTTEEICDALEEGNELPAELIETILKMAPTAEEELKLRLYTGELSQLGPAERFLKVLVDIPYAFKRLEALLFMCTLQEETTMLKESFAVLEAACTEVRKSTLFLKLLEAVLKTGNRMNDGTFRGGAQAFKLDTLLKLSDVKGTDGKTTLLHFVVQEIIHSEGIRAARAAKDTQSMSSFKSDDLLEEPTQDSDEHLRSLGLQVVSSLGNELENVKKAAVVDVDSLTGTVSKLGHALKKSRDFLNSDMKNVPKENGFHQTLRSFVQNAEVDVRWSLEEEKRIMALVKNTADYFHGNSAKDEGLRLFVIVRDFIIILDKVCKEVKNVPRKSSTITRKEDTVTTRKEDTVATPPDTRPMTTPDPRLRLFPAITDTRMYTSSSDDES